VFAGVHFELRSVAVTAVFTAVLENCYGASVVLERDKVFKKIVGICCFVF